MGRCENACITGDHYLYCFDERTPSESVVTDMTPRLKMRLIDKTALYLADEQEPNLEEQEWIIIAERVPVENVRRQAKDNGLPEAEIRRIVSDEADETQLGVTGADEVQTDSGKCTSLLFMRKTDGGVAFCRSTQAVVYQPMQTIRGLDVYPVCGMRWEEKMGSARGVGVVERLIPNQIEVNRTLARRAICVKRYSFPTVVYDQDKLLAPEKLGVVGASIGVKNLNANPVGSFVQYLSPAPISGDAANLQAELVGTSRELEGAGEAATGQVDPTKASGEAIKAARDQSAISLNEQSAAYKQFVEDLAMIWYKLWVAYSVRGLRLADGTLLPHAELEALDIDIKSTFRRLTRTACFPASFRWKTRWRSNISHLRNTWRRWTTIPACRRTSSGPFWTGAGGPRRSKAKAGQAKTSAPAGRRARFHRRRRCPAWSLRAVACRAVCPAPECP